MAFKEIFARSSDAADNFSGGIVWKLDGKFYGPRIIGADGLDMSKYVIPIAFEIKVFSWKSGYIVINDDISIPGSFLEIEYTKC